MPSCEYCNARFDTQQGVRSHVKQKAECRLAFARSLSTPTSTSDSTAATHSLGPSDLSDINDLHASHVENDSPGHGLASRPYPVHPIQHDRLEEMPDDSPSKRRRVTVEEVQDVEAGLPSKPWIEDFPAPAGTPLRAGKTYFEDIRDRKEGESESPFAPFADEEEWELAQWLATSGISQKALDAFLKLSIVRHLTTQRPI